MIYIYIYIFEGFASAAGPLTSGSRYILVYKSAPAISGSLSECMAVEVFGGVRGVITLFEFVLMWHYINPLVRDRKKWNCSGGLFGLHCGPVLV